MGQSLAAHHLVTTALGEEEGEGGLGGNKGLTLLAAALGSCCNGALLLVRNCNNLVAKLLLFPINS